MSRLFTTEKATLQSAVHATANGEIFDCSGLGSIGVEIAGTFVGTITFQLRISGGAWTAVQVVNMADGAVATTATATGLFYVPCAGFSEFRAPVTWTSGTSVTVTAQGGIIGGGISTADIDIAGSEVVTLGAGTAAYGKLAANSGVDIGDVDVTSITAGETHIGEVGGADILITATPTVTAGAYSANDAVGGMLTFANAARVSGAGGIIKSVVFVDDAGQDAETELWLFDTTITAVGDNAAFAQAEAELHTLVAVISSTDGTWRASGTPSACDVEVSRGYTCTGTSLFGQLVTRGTPTYAATDDITVRIQLVQN